MVLQGVDYVYTIRGWLKGINHTIGGYDPGNDGPGTNGYGSDVFGMVLGYYDGDFTRSGSPYNSGGGTNSLHLSGLNGLYDGNIRSWTSRGKIYTRADQAWYGNRYINAPGL